MLTRKDFLPRVLFGTPNEPAGGPVPDDEPPLPALEGATPCPRSDLRSPITFL